MFDIVGFDTSYKVPVFAVDIQYAAGPQIGQGGLNVLLAGMIDSASGDLEPDVEVRQVFSQVDADRAAGEGTQLARMAIAAFGAVPQGVNIYLAAVSEPVGDKATATLVFSGTWTVSGQFTIAIAGKNITVGILSTDTIDTFGAALEDAINGIQEQPFTAAYDSGSNTLTLTCKNKGSQGQRWIIVQDETMTPTGFASALTGSSTIRDQGGVKMVFAGASSTGTGVESVTTLLTNLTMDRWARIGVGQLDATNATEWKDFINERMAPLVQVYQMAVFALNGASADAVTRATTILNDPNAQLFAMRNSETHPSEIAAGWAALRAGTEGDDPVPDYDRKSCASWVAAHRFREDDWLATEQNVLLNSGVTPISTIDSEARCVRAITTYCRFNGGPDERCLDIGDAVFPAYAAIALTNLYWSQFRAANKYVQDDVPNEEPDPRSGVGTPKLWTSTVKALMQDWHENHWIQDTFSGDSPKYPVLSAFNQGAQRIQGKVQLVVQRVQHQLGEIIQQTAPG